MPVIGIVLLSWHSAEEEYFTWKHIIAKTSYQCSVQSRHFLWSEKGCHFHISSPHSFHSTVFTIIFLYAQVIFLLFFLPNNFSVLINRSTFLLLLLIYFISKKHLHILPAYYTGVWIGLLVCVALHFVCLSYWKIWWKSKTPLRRMPTVFRESSSWFPTYYPWEIR